MVNMIKKTKPGSFFNLAVASVLSFIVLFQSVDSVMAFAPRSNFMGFAKTQNRLTRDATGQEKKIQLCVAKDIRRTNSDNSQSDSGRNSTNDIIIVIDNSGNHNHTTTTTKVDLLRNHAHISPLDGDHGLHYLDPLHRFPKQRQDVYKLYNGTEDENHWNVTSASDAFPGTGQKPNKRKHNPSYWVTSNFFTHRTDLGWYAMSPDRDNGDSRGCPPLQLISQAALEGEEDRAESATKAEPNADAGDPQSVSRLLAKSEFRRTTATNKMGKGGGNQPTALRNITHVPALDTVAVSLSCGFYRCSRGGWKSPPLGGGGGDTTKVHWVQTGFACLTDRDGERHFFGPGDTVIVPGGWLGRWDIAEDLKTVWFEHKSGGIEIERKDTEEVSDSSTEDTDDLQTDDDTAAVVRARVIRYHELTPPDTKGYVQRSEHLLYASTATCKNVTLAGGGGKTTPGPSPTPPLAVSCVVHKPTPGFVPARPRPSFELVYLLEGSMELITRVGNRSYQRESSQVVCAKRGDLLVLPEGWSGRCRLLETVKALRILA